MNGLVSNDQDSVKIRKNRATLLVTGAGVAAFGVWSVIKVFMEFMIIPVDDEIAAMMADVDDGGAVFVTLFVALIFMTDVILRVYVFSRALKESRGEKVRRYLFSSLIVISGSVLSLGYVLFKTFSDSSYELSINDEVSLFVEVTSLVIIIEMLIASSSYRRLMAKKRREASDGDAA